MDKGIQPYRSIWLAGATLLVLLVLNWMLTPMFVSETRLESMFRPKGKLPFDSTQWKTAHPSSGTRYMMVDTLLDEKIRVGDSLEEVESILGKPEILEKRGTKDLHVSYTLGSQSQFPARSFLFRGRLSNSELWVLRIHFENGTLRSFSVVPS